MKNLLRIFALLFLAGFMAGSLYGQEKKTTPAQDPKFQVYVDTAGVAPVDNAPGHKGPTYITWVYAKTSDNAPPSAGVLVAFDCGSHQVARLAHVVFHLASDGKSVEGNIEEDEPEWVPVTNQTTFNLVCQVGAEHAKGNWGPDAKSQDHQPRVVDPRVRQA